MANQANNVLTNLFDSLVTRLGTNRSVSLIDENLYLSSVETALDLKAINSLQIQRILTLDSTPLEHSQQGITYLFIKVNDSPNEDLLSHFEDCYRFISEGVLKGHKVLVHCVAGVSRSATIVISYLMIKHSLPFPEAMALVRKKRPIIDPNPGFERQLRLFSKMNRKLDAMNGQFRQFLVEYLRHRMLRCRPWINPVLKPSNVKITCEPLSQYFKKLRDFMPKNNLSERQEFVYKCRKCRLFLFNAINVFSNSSAEESGSQHKPDSACHCVYVEPLDWMLSFICGLESGPINCCNCFSKLGHFDWKGISCQTDCIEHKDLNCLVFRIELKKVDSPYIQL